MSNFEPRLIRRIGVAVEMADGELITLYSETPTVEMHIETHVETERYIGERAHEKVVAVESSTDITITGIRQLNATMRAPEATAQAIENAKAITEGNK